MTSNPAIISTTNYPENTAFSDHCHSWLSHVLINNILSDQNIFCGAQLGENHLHYYLI